MSNDDRSLMWFRDDLRVGDNPALSAATASGGPVAAVYFAPDDQGGARPLGAAALWKLDGALRALARDLAELNVPLLLTRGAPSEKLPEIAEKIGATAVSWNRRYEPAAVEIDKATKAACADAGLEATSYNGALLVEPWQVKTADGGFYKVFSPFCKAARKDAPPPAPKPRPEPARAWDDPPGSPEDIDDWALKPTKPDWAGGLRETWAHGEDAARERLQAFIKEGFSGYRKGRDLMAANHVSALSPYLRFGEISPRQAREAAGRAVEDGDASDADFEAFERELYWRDFAYNLLFHANDLAKANFQSKFDEFPWRNSAADLKAWTRGETGYPVVDAGMRQLWETGWMHNRTRMVVASFLTKHLLIDWREGEAWFWDTLVDADVASNPSNWQWVAGSGADAAPYFRIFNPMTQGEKFDGDGAYVRRWLPELADLPDKYIHAPWTAPDDVLSDAGVKLGVTYPKPIVDHKPARERALDAFKSIS